MQTRGAKGIESFVADSMVTIQLHVGTDLQCGDNAIIVFTLMMMTG
jgi:hypothetical protein